MRRAVSDRARQLARIHMGRKALGLDEETYRALLQRVTGKRSSAEMSADERNAVIVELTRLGFRADATRSRARAFQGRPRNIDEVPLLRKVEALLAASGRPWAYAHGLARRMFGVARVEWCRQDQLHRLTAALQIDANRRTRP